MKIDIFPHVMPKNYGEELRKLVRERTDLSELAYALLRPRNRILDQIDSRLRFLDNYPDVVQVLTVSTPPLETVASPSDAVKLARIANDELAELVAKYPDKFIAAVACLPLNDVDATLEETDRAITQLGLKGIQIFSNINGESLSLPKFRPLYEKMVQYDLPIWIHPWDEPGKPHIAPFCWPYETSVTMSNLVNSGVMADYPDIKFIIHHCGAMVPFFAGRVKWAPVNLAEQHINNPLDYFHKFYVDTAVYGNTGALMCGYDFFGADRMLYGTDMPLGAGPYGLTLETIESIERMDISDENKNKIFEGNARRLLRLGV